MCSSDLELSQDGGSKIMQNVFALASGNPDMKVDLIDKSDISNTIGISALSVLIPSIPKLFQSRNINKKSYYQGLYTLSQFNQNEFEQNVSNNVASKYITQEEGNQLINNVNIARQALTKMPSDMPMESKAELLPEIINKKIGRAHV